MVDVKLAGNTNEVDALELVLHERLDGTDLVVAYERLSKVDVAGVVTPGPTSDVQLARIWIDLTSPERATLYIVDGAWEHVLVRHTPRSENPEVTREGLGHIVELALLALRDGQQIGIGRDTAREQLLPRSEPPALVRAARREKPVAATVARASPPTFHVGVFYEALAYGSGIDIASGPGLSFGAQKETARRLTYGLAFTGQYRLPSFASGESASVRTEAGALRLLTTFGVPIGRRTTLTGMLGGGLDIVDFDARGTRVSNLVFASDATGSSSELDVIPVVRAGARLERRTSDLRIHFGAGIDTPLRETSYVIQRQNGRERIFAPWLVRPFFVVGVETP